METNTTSISKHKTRARATFVGICAQTIVSYLRSVHARGAARGAWEREIHFNFHLGGYFVLPVCWASCFLKQSGFVANRVARHGARMWLFKNMCSERLRKSEKRFDCRCAYGLRVSPCHGTHKAAQNYVQKKRFHNCFFLRNISKNMQHDTIGAPVRCSTLKLNPKCPKMCPGARRYSNK